MYKLTVTPSPQIRGNVSTQRIMLAVIAALVPAVIAGTLLFGIRALLVIFTCTISCVMFEYLSRLIMKRSNTVSDFSAAVTGVLLALNLPSTIPLRFAIIGSFVAIVVVKQLFGGLGQNFANPAIVARIVLMLSFPSYMSGSAFVCDAFTGATPLADPAHSFTYAQLFLGKCGGCIGETCALALIIGGIFLVAVRVISPAAPLSFITVLAVCTLIAGGDPVYQILSGGVLLGAIFMATDYVTTPLTFSGKLVFGAGCGLITFVIRFYASIPEGVSYSILIMNILTPYIDMFTKKRIFGIVKEKKEADAQ